ncbi:calponin homology domain-containing protein DDB_G0272472-like [Microplitis mediator]|uniref:calponin homology domain-containing protein DDB_G0272472-like n=1 Tax=Microplitis mediator TaxID=375433 RepID=UPI0025522F8A|nr:calponin homology domain-containing protein DDB_G0272472-like [Microplitis mediator]
MKLKSKEISKKSSVTALTLCISENTFNRLNEYTTEAERINLIAEKKAKKLAELKNASNELSKDWPDAIANITKKRREELLSRKRRVNEENVKLLKQLADENLKERMKIVKEAQKLILYKKPQCRLINSALFTSECFRELQAQIEFNKMIKNIDNEQNQEYIEKLRKDTEDFDNEKQIAAKKLWEKKENYRNELKTQIENSESNLKKIESFDRNADKKDLDNVIEELKLIEQCEAEQMRNKKQKLQEMFLESIKNKELEQERLKNHDISVNNLVEAYAKAKDHLNEMTQAKWKEIQAEKIRRSELMAKKCAVIWETDEKESEDRLQKAIQEREEIEIEKMKARENKKQKLKADIEKYQAEHAATIEKRKQEEENEKKWEAYQRYKRDEYNKEIKLKEMQKEQIEKKKIAQDLKTQMKEQEDLRREEMIKNDDSIYTTEALKKINEKVLAYGEEVLEESRGVRPLFPIIKVIEQFKKENKFLLPTKYEQHDSPKQKCGIRKIKSKQFCSNKKCISNNFVQIKE